MDPIATTSSASASTTWWRRSVRRRGPEAEEERELERRVEEMEDSVERLRAEKEEAEAEGELRAELDAERAAAETAASEAMLMIERLQREKAAALMEARQFRRLAEGRADRDRELQDELASLSALTASYLSRLHAHGIDPADGEDDAGNKQKEQPPVEHLDAEADEESCCSCGGGSDSDFNDTVVFVPVLPSAAAPNSEKEFEYAAHVKCVAATAAEDCAVNISANLYARVEALEADWTTMCREVAALRAERAQAVLAREVARRLCREAVAAERGIVATTAEKPRCSVLAICKGMSFRIFRRKRCSTARFTFGLSAMLLCLLLLVDRSIGLHRRRCLPRTQM
ncbi:hypothetical protein E2562_022334 [Oryza meyeriana var. granulata]|uniref:GTD-binding domain-containing protein n=1 Tax=Oryza meyeriana var. granulata TaxID=110450 RepID=A0A6G1D5C3_9ORYZ|nr:hypothetical protein E2562_022334 [Oryza meyeriana var. granulata]